MTRYTRLHARTTGGHDIRINGECVNVLLARITHKCAECLGDLELHNAGLRCQDNHEHRGFVHRDEAAEIKQQQAAQVAEIEAAYEIRDGQIVPKELV